MKHYLAPSKHIDFDRSDDIQTLARQLAANAPTELALVRASFEFVRDEIRHSADFNLNPVTCQASDVLRHRTGYCFAKSHLLAALLRANGIPTGLCYQRLTVGSGPDAPHCLHGLNAVHLTAHGWYRLDPRGNKAGVDAQFQPPREALAFAIRYPGERDLPEIWAEPLACVVDALERHDTWDQVLANLPDVELIAGR